MDANKVIQHKRLSRFVLKKIKQALISCRYDIYILSGDLRDEYNNIVTYRNMLRHTIEIIDRERNKVYL
jgi:hypothetical protein